jgi:hypothetical protein
VPKGALCIEFLTSSPPIRWGLRLKFHNVPVWALCERETRPARDQTLERQALERAFGQEHAAPPRLALKTGARGQGQAAADAERGFIWLRVFPSASSARSRSCRLLSAIQNSALVPK